MDSEIIIEEGVNNSRIFTLNGETVFAKELSRNFNKKRNFIKKLNLLLQENFFISPFFKHTIEVGIPETYIRKELLTWQLWKREGFPVLRLVETDHKKFIKWQYENYCISYSALLNSKQSFYEFEKMLNLYSRIRRVAIEKNNVNLLHSDPNIGNFLYDKKRKLSIPIDADTLLNPRMNIYDLNIALLNIMLSSILQVRQKDYIVKQYVSLFGKSLSHSELEGLYRFNRKFPLMTKIYYRIRDEIRVRVKREKPNLLFLQEKNFQKRYNTCVKNVLFT